MFSANLNERTQPATMPYLHYQPNSSRNIKRKCQCDDDGDSLSDGTLFHPKKANLMSAQSATVPLAAQHLSSSSDVAEFYALPKDLNQAVLASMELEGSKDQDNSIHAWPKQSFRSSPGLFEPPAASTASLDPQSMDEETEHPQQTRHGPQCRSIPQLSVRQHGSDPAELWAYCPDCCAFGKVQDD